MRAAYLAEQGRLVMIEADMPAIQAPDQVLIQIKAVGICGSEVHAFEGTHPFRKAPTLLGHEAAGIVTAVGEAVTSSRPGDRVIIDPQWPCGQCEYCQAGDINLCPEKRVMGTPAWPGAFGEYVIAPQTAVFPLPAPMSFIQGAMVEPLTVGVHVARRANLKAGRSAVILGSGSIGGLLSAVCGALGAYPIIVADIRRHCLVAARERLGASHDFLLPDSAFPARVKDLTGGRGADVVFITADDISLMDIAIEILKPGGTIVLVALLTEAPLQLTAYDIISKEKRIIGSSMSRHEDVREAIALAASGRVDVEGIVTHVLPIEQAQYGMRLASTKEDEAIKVVLVFE